MERARVTRLLGVPEMFFLNLGSDYECDKKNLFVYLHVYCTSIICLKEGVFLSIVNSSKSSVNELDSV